MKQLIITLFLVIATGKAYTQSDLKIDFNYKSFYISDSIKNDLSFDQIVTLIKDNFKTDQDKLLFVAGWMLKNLEFDTDKFISGGTTNSHKIVFAERKGICGDYAELFSAFCNKLNIPNEIIEGYVSEYEMNNMTYVETNHAWNAVLLNGEWYHCDLLGLSGYIQKNNSNAFEFIKSLNPSNFLTREKEFIAQHIPADPMWQLSHYPIPIDTLIAYGSNAKTDSNSIKMDYNKMIEKYRSLNAMEKKLVFADKAFVYNPNNANIIVVNYYNAAAALINNWKKDKRNLVKAKQYLQKCQAHIPNAKNGVESLKTPVNDALKTIKKYDATL